MTRKPTILHTTTTPRAILADVVDSRAGAAEAEYRLSEARGLVDTYGGLIIVETVQRRASPDPKTYMGSGKVQEIATMAQEMDVDVIIVNDTLKPRQLYTIEEAVRAVVKPRKVEVWDRVDLILKIFAKHARSAEANLQITLASLQHMGPRIYRMGMDLSQQGGGIGTRGAGETNTEMMKRHLRELNRNVKKKLEELTRVRDNQRYGRKRRGMRTVSLVGYTNVGKSSLLRALTRKGVYVADQLFATLDTSLSKLYVEGSNTDIILSDTIGFIENLPPSLVSAFRSTLEEAIEADLLLIVADGSDEKAVRKMRVTLEVLEQLGVSEKPAWIVWNKLDDGVISVAEANAVMFPQHKHFFVSARTGFGLDELRVAIGDWFAKN